MTPEQPTRPDPRIPALRRIRTARRRLVRTRKKIRSEAARAESAPGLRHEADLWLANLHRWSPGGEALEVVDWLTGEPRILELPSRITPSVHADRLYRQARRFERGAELSEARLRSLDAKIEALDRVLEDEDSTPDELLELAGLRIAAPKRAAPAGERRPYRRFLTDEGEILVGRGAKDNDTLTMSIARPRDLWLHARSMRGAHVVVPLDRNRTCPPALLADAAMLAAHFSEAHSEAVVDVQYTPRRYVRKRRGMPVGAVAVDRDRTLAVRMDPARLRALLAREA